MHPLPFTFTFTNETKTQWYGCSLTTDLAFRPTRQRLRVLLPVFSDLHRVDHAEMNSKRWHLQTEKKLMTKTDIRLWLAAGEFSRQKTQTTKTGTKPIF